jgi:hypothetical protein
VNRMKATKSKIIMGVGVVALIFSAYRFGYHRGYMAQGPIVHFERDTADAPAQGSAKTGHEPYFTKANPIPTEVK